MNKRIHAHAKENRFGIPILLTIDQEGGQLTAIHQGTTMSQGIWQWDLQMMKK